MHTPGYWEASASATTLELPMLLSKNITTQRWDPEFSSSSFAHYLSAANLPGHTLEEGKGKKVRATHTHCILLHNLAKGNREHENILPKFRKKKHCGYFQKISKIKTPFFSILEAQEKPSWGEVSGTTRFPKWQAHTAPADLSRALSLSFDN